MEVKRVNCTRKGQRKSPKKNARIINTCVEGEVEGGGSIVFVLNYRPLN